MVSASNLYILYLRWKIVDSSAYVSLSPAGPIIYVSPGLFLRLSLSVLLLPQIGSAGLPDQFRKVLFIGTYR